MMTRLFFVLIILCFYSVMLYFVNGQSPLEVSVALQLLNVDTIDLSNGLFNANFLLLLFLRNGQLYQPNIVYFNNGFQSLTIVNNTDHFQVWGTFAFAPNTVNYPFDTQNLIIVLESTLPVEQLVYVADPNRTSVSNELRLKGLWDYTPISWSTDVQEFWYPAEEKTVSQYVFTFDVERPLGGGFRKLLPPLFIIVTVLVSFIIPVANSISRLGIVTSALVAEVFYHNNLPVPFTGDIMIADWLMIICYAIIVVSIIENVIVIFLYHSNDPKKKLAVSFIEQRARILVWLVFPCFFLFLFIPWWVALICLVLPTAIAWSIRLLIFRKHQQIIQKLLFCKFKRERTNPFVSLQTYLSRDRKTSR
jgi:hypothetical protein